MKRITIILVIAACSPAGLVMPGLVTCSSDAECGSGQICFPEGCGDPGTGIAIEVTGSNSTGLYEQDFAIADGSLSPALDVQINGGLSLVGELLREKSAGIDPANRAVFAEPVQVVAIGSSTVLPGLSRSYQATFNETANGVFSMPIGAGTYRVTAQPTSGSLPPMTVSNVSSKPGVPGVATFAFASVEGSVVISGRLLKLRTESPVVETPLDSAMDLQAFDPVNGQAVSQKVPVPSGAAAKGDFILTMTPSVRQMGSLLLVATSRESRAVVPSKTFVIATPVPSVVTLTMGDYGSAKVLTGQAIDSMGTPVAGASVVIEGVVKGDGRFRSKIGTTDAMGLFALEVLANAPGQLLILTVAPPAGHSAAVTQVPVDVEKSLQPAPFVCADRIVLSGVLTRPDGSPASGVKVQASETSGSARTLPLADRLGVTDMNGGYSLALDTGSWRLDFVPGEDLPRFSRLVKVRSALETDGGIAKTLVLGTLSLPKGRRISGTVSNIGGVEVALMPDALVRYFRVTQIEGKPASVLMATAIADSKGRYTVTLPTR